MLIIGTKAEAIELRPVACALAERGIVPTLIFIGGHQDPDLVELDCFPTIDVYCPWHEDPHRHVQIVTAALLPRFRNAPDLVVVQGGSSCALGGALAAFVARVPVAHVEAGIRTHDPTLDLPEEEYRAAIDADADLLFAPSELAASNLRSERVPGEIHVTGHGDMSVADGHAAARIARIIHDWAEERSLTRRLA